MAVNKRPVVIMAGGTGGHVIPALTIASELQSRGIKISWLGTRNGLEHRLVPEAGFEIDYLPIHGVRGSGLLKKCLAPFSVMVAIIYALFYLIRRRPGCVIGLGGFASGPGGAAAVLCRIPLVIHEQNAVSGVTNRLLGPWARIIFQSYPHVFPARLKPRDTGNPVRGPLLNLPLPPSRFADHTGPIRVLVLGGSRGAQMINTSVPQALALLPSDVQISLRHQCGSALLESTRAVYTQMTLPPGIEAKLMPFIDDMAEAYGWADWVIARAGALTVAELAAVGLGSLLIPYPHAVDDHQTANAAILRHAQAAFVIPQNELTPECLAGHLEKIVRAGRVECLKRALAAASVGRREATAQIVNECLEIMRP